jgi:PIN domain nuclease of toxin-antitoxin system
VVERFVVDASAILALLNSEPGADPAASLLSSALMSAVNWSEVLQKSRSHGVSVEGLDGELESLGLAFVPFDRPEAAEAASIWHLGGRSLSLADRACLATAAIRGLTAITADRAWASLDLGIEVQVIR